VCCHINTAHSKIQRCCFCKLWSCCFHHTIRFCTFLVPHRMIAMFRNCCDYFTSFISQNHVIWKRDVKDSQERQQTFLKFLCKIKIILTRCCWWVKVILIKVHLTGS
jgi:hypothetical protein